MDRSSFIKSLFVVAAAPKIISQLDITTQAIADHKKVSEGFMGIIPSIMNGGYTITLNNLSNFSLEDFKKTMQNMDDCPNQYYHFIQPLTYN